MESTVAYLNLWLAIALLLLITKGRSSEDPEEGLGLVLTEEPHDVVVTKGSSFLWNCSAENSMFPDQSATITWHKDGHEIEADSRKYTLRNGSLYFKRVIHRKQRGRSDEGFYQCVAKNRFGALVSRKARLQVASMSRIPGVPQELSAVEGEVVRLQCPISAEPSATYTWEQDKKTLPQPDNPQQLLISSGVLQIDGVSPSDAGRYRCTASTGQESRSSVTMQLTVQPATPKLSIAAKMMVRAQTYVTGRVGEKVLLECAASGLPKPTITWTFKPLLSDGEVTPVLGERFSMVGHGNLQVSALQLADAGIYVCSAVNTASEQPQEAEVNLKVLEAPVLVEGPETSVSVGVASVTRFTCIFSGSPTPNITWLKNGREIINNGRIKIRNNGATLVFQSATTDSGYYQCIAENEAGSAMAALKLTIKPTDGAPEPPDNLRTEATSSNSIRLTWDAAVVKNKDHKIMAYSVHYHPTRGGAELQKVAPISGGGSATEHLDIDQLEPFTEYTFYIVAYSLLGAPSAHSQTVTQITNEDVPIAAPPMRVSALGMTSLKVQWDVLTPEKANGIITEYQVIHRKRGSPTQHVEYVDAPNTEYIIIDLKPQVEYDVRVMARTKVGWANLDDEKWPWHTAVTDHPPGGPEPPEIKVIPVNSTSVNVTWKRVDSGSTVEVEGYKLSYEKLDENRQIVTLGAETTSYLITKLDADSWYQVTLLSYNQHRESEPTVMNVQTLPGEGLSGIRVPAPPCHLEAIPDSANSIFLTWEASEHPSPVKHYTLMYSQVMEDSTHSNESVKYVISEKTEVSIENLEPFTMYEFSVRADTETTQGQFTSLIRAQTKEGRPSAPVHVSLVLLDARLVELSWKPPAQKNGIIISYVILYCEDKEKPDSLWKVQTENGTVTWSRVNNLQSNVMYYFKLRAATSAGEGPDTQVMSVRTYSPQVSITPDPEYGNQQEMGIFVGVSIGGACIIISIIIILMRNRCFPPRYAPPTSNNGQYHNTNGYLPSANGHGYLPQPVTEYHEIGAASIPENHIDSKGGYGNDLIQPYNGVNVSSLRVVYQPNGQVTTALTNEYQASPPQAPVRTTSLQNASHESIDGGAPSGDPTEAGHIDGSVSLEDVDGEDTEADERGPMLSSTPARSGQPPPSCRQDHGPQTAPTTGSYNNGAPSVDRHTHYSLSPHMRQDDGDDVGEERQALLSHHCTATSQSTAPAPGGATSTSPTSGHDQRRRRQDCPSPTHTTSHSSEPYNTTTTDSQSRSQGNSHRLASNHPGDSNNPPSPSPIPPPDGTPSSSSSHSSLC